MFRSILSFLFENKGTRQTVAKNTTWLFIGEVISRLLRTSLVVYAARVLGTSGWGAFSYALTLATLFGTFSDIGVGAILTREVARGGGNRQKYLSTSFYIKIALLGLTLPFIIWLAPAVTNVAQARPLMWLAAFILLFDSLREFGLSLSRALEKMENEALSKIATNLLIMLFGFLLLSRTASPKMLAVSYALGTGIGLLVLIWFLRKNIREFTHHFSPELLKPIFKAALPFAILGVFGVAMMNVDTLMLGWWKSTSDIGLYAASQRILQLIYMLPTLLSAALFPAMARLAHHDAVRFRAILERAISISLLVAIPIAVGGIIIAPEIIRLLFGGSYVPGAATLRILLLTVVVIFPNYFINNAIFAYDRQLRGLKFVIIGAVVNVVGNYFLIPIYGTAGAALATVCAQAVGTLLLWRMLKQINNFVIFPRLGKVIAATALTSFATIATHAAGWPVIGSIVLSIGVYTTFLCLLREPLLREITALRGQR